MLKSVSRSLAAALLLGAAALHAQSDPTSRSWNQPVEPYRIAGNLYYVGASDVTSFLIATPRGTSCWTAGALNPGGWAPSRLSP